MSKDDWAKAERAAEHWLISLGCVATRRAVRARFQKVDFFGADIIGRLQNGCTIWVQVTCGSSANVAHRRRKLESFPWAKCDNVILAEMRSAKVGRAIEYRFRVHEYRGAAWEVWEFEQDIPREWLKAVKKERKL